MGSNDTANENDTTVQVPENSTVLIVTTTAEAVVIKAADIEAAQSKE